MARLDPTRWLGLGLTLKTWGFIALGVVLLLGASFGVGYGFGYGSGGVAATEKAAEDARELAALVAADKLEAEHQLGLANAANRQQELDHEQRISDLRAEFAAADAAARADDARRLADLRAGNDRLWLQVRRCGASGPGAAGPAPGGADGETRAELAPEAAAALYGIAADGDSAIRQLTGLQAWADSAVKLCSSPPPSE